MGVVPRKGLSMMPEPENEVVNLIREIQKEMAEHFDEMDRRFDLINKRLEEIGSEYGKCCAVIEQRTQPVK
jgi:hypothetical protein